MKVNAFSSGDASAEGALSPPDTAQDRLWAGETVEDSLPAGSTGQDGLPARDSDIDVPSTAGQPDAWTDSSPFAPCPLSLSGPPLSVAFAKGAMWRGVTLLDPGDVHTSPARPIHLALHAFVDLPGDPAIELADVHIPAAWPSAIDLDHTAVVVGPAAHSDTAAAVTGDRNTLILTYYGHPLGFPGGLELVPVDVATWTTGAFVRVSEGQWAAPRGIASGAGMGAGASFSGQGFGIGWSVIAPDAGVDELKAAVMRNDGTLAAGPWLLSAAGGDSQLTTAVAWTGTTYLFARASKTCAPVDPLCRPASVTIARVTNDADAATVQLSSTFPTPGGACCAALAAYGGSAWAVWFENAVTDGSAASNLRLVQMDSYGVARQSPVTIAGATPAISNVAIAANRLGVLVAWMEKSVGRGRLQLHQFGPDGAELDTAVSIDVPLYSSYPEINLAVVENPPGMLIGWAAGIEGDVSDPASTTWLARMECAQR
jgi:hypothetical protein